MALSPRGWTGAKQAKPASDLDIRFGHGLLESESSGWPSYLAVTTPSAYKAAHASLAREPEGVGYVRWLDRKHLQEVTDSMPGGTELVVGIGGGTALDASKFVALSLGLPLIVVPSVVSTGAIIHGVSALWEGYKVVGNIDVWPWIDYEHILVDYDVVLKAPYYLNTAGLGDVLHGYSGIAEWKRNTRLGVGPPFSEERVATMVQHHEDIVTTFPKTLGPDGSLSDDSIRVILTAIQERDVKIVRGPETPMADHPFSQAIENINGKGWVHGELCGLGAIIIAWHCEESPETPISWFDACKVRRRPSEMGISREELRKALEFLPTYISDHPANRQVNTILRNEPIVGERFEALWEFLESA